MAAKSLTREQCDQSNEEMERMKPGARVSYLYPRDTVTTSNVVATALSWRNQENENAEVLLKVRIPLHLEKYNTLIFMNFNLEHGIPPPIRRSSGYSVCNGSGYDFRLRGGAQNRHH